MSRIWERQYCDGIYKKKKKKKKKRKKKEVASISNYADLAYNGKIHYTSLGMETIRLLPVAKPNHTVLYCA